MVIQKGEDLIGKEVTITDKTSWACGEWGVVKDFDGEYYHVAPWNGETQIVFTRSDFRVKRR